MGKVVQVLVDNKAVVGVLTAIFCSEIRMYDAPYLATYLLAAKFNFWFTAAYISGKNYGGPKGRAM